MCTYSCLYQALTPQGLMQTPESLSCVHFRRIHPAPESFIMRSLQKNSSSPWVLYYACTQQRLVQNWNPLCMHSTRIHANPPVLYYAFTPQRLIQALSPLSCLHSTKLIQALSLLPCIHSTALHKDSSRPWVLYHAFTSQGFIQTLSHLPCVYSTRTHADPESCIIYALYNDSSRPWAIHHACTTQEFTQNQSPLPSMHSAMTYPDPESFTMCSQRYSLHIEDILKAGKVSLIELQLIIGQLQYAICVVNPGNAFLRMLINLTIDKRILHFFIKLTKGARLDLEIWKTFLVRFNGKSLMYEPHIADSNTVKLFSDS